MPLFIDVVSIATEMVPDETGRYEFEIGEQYLDAYLKASLPGTATAVGTIFPNNVDKLFNESNAITRQKNVPFDGYDVCFGI